MKGRTSDHDGAVGARASVLIVAAQASTRRALRVALELDGLSVIEASSPRQARGLLADDGGLFVGAVVDVALQGALELASELTGSDIVGHTVVLVRDGEDVPDHLECVGPPELPHVARRLAAAAADAGDEDDDAVAEVATLLRRELDDLVGDWRELCEWDPMLPPEALPAIAPAVVAAVVDALARPQPLGWGPDPEVEKVAVVFGSSVPSLDVAVGQLICLREAIRRRLAGRLTPRVVAVSADRLSMVVDRAVGCCVAAASARLERDAHVDPLTNLGNRRALERDLRRVLGRASRSGGSARLLLLQAVDLREVNATVGHAAGDRLLQSLAAAVLDAVGDDDGAYRAGGDELVVLGFGDADWGELLAGRIAASGAATIAWGTSSPPEDGTELAGLLDVAARSSIRSPRC